MTQWSWTGKNMELYEGFVHQQFQGGYSFNGRLDSQGILGEMVIHSSLKHSPPQHHQQNGWIGWWLLSWHWLTIKHIENIHPGHFTFRTKTWLSFQLGDLWVPCWFWGDSCLYHFEGLWLRVSWQPFGPLLKVKLLVSYVLYPDKLKGAKGIRLIQDVPRYII